MTEEKQKEVQTKVFIFGPWVTVDKDGKAKVDEDGQQVADWMRSDSDEITPELGKLLRMELRAEAEYRNVILNELDILRSKYLGTANAVVGELTNPGKTLVEAYNNGLKMGEHTAGANMAQWLSDLLDKLKLRQAVTHGK